MKYKHKKKEDIPEALKEYYEEKDGAYFLKSIEGLVPQKELDEIKIDLSELKKEKSDIESKFSPFKDMDSKEIEKQLNELKELKLKGGGDIKDPEKVEELVKIKTAELNKQLETANSELEKLTEERNGLRIEKIKNLTSKKIKDLTFDKDKQDYTVRPGSIPDIELNVHTNFDYNEDVNDFIHKESKEKLSDWLPKTAEERGWLKGSTGDGDPGGNGKARQGSEGKGTILDNMNEAWNK